MSNEKPAKTTKPADQAPVLIEQPITPPQAAPAITYPCEVKLTKAVDIPKVGSLVTCRGTYDPFTGVLALDFRGHTILKHIANADVGAVKLLKQ
jgi:hypothetical protein